MGISRQSKAAGNHHPLQGGWDCIANERGDTIMLEAVIIWPTVTFLLMVFLGFYSIMYQVWNLDIVVNDVAARTGLMFRYVANQSVYNPLTGAIELSQLQNSNPYRYYQIGREQLEARVRELVEERLIDSDQALLNRSQIGQPKEPPEITLDIVSNKMARNHISIRVKAKYDIPFLGAMRWLAPDAAPPDTIEAVGRADCLDLTDYIVTTNYARSMSSKLAVLRDMGISEDDIAAIGTRAASIQRVIRMAFSE